MEVLNHFVYLIWGYVMTRPVTSRYTSALWLAVPAKGFYARITLCINNLIGCLEESMDQRYINYSGKRWDNNGERAPRENNIKRHLDDTKVLWILMRTQFVVIQKGSCQWKALWWCSVQVPVSFLTMSEVDARLKVLQKQIKEPWLIDVSREKSRETWESTKRWNMPATVAQVDRVCPAVTSHVGNGSDGLFKPRRLQELMLHDWHLFLYYL